MTTHTKLSRRYAVVSTLKKILLAAILTGSTAMTPPDNTITVYLIGDSTMADKQARAFPETGWGTPFKTFFDSSVVVDNRAKNGRSTKSFIAEGLWQPVVDGLKEGDYVFIQFGHNDEVTEKVGRYTTPQQFMDNLKRFVAETREKNAIPVLLSPATRRTFDAQGNVVETHPEYSPLVKRVAEETQTPFIDVDKKSRALVQQFGEAYSRYLFMQLEPREHPTYPAGKNDNTHFNELGARLVAQIVLSEMVTLRLGLSEHIVNAR